MVCGEEGAVKWVARCSGSEWVGLKVGRGPKRSRTSGLVSQFCVKLFLLPSSSLLLFLTVLEDPHQVQGAEAEPGGGPDEHGGGRWRLQDHGLGHLLQGRAPHQGCVGDARGKGMRFLVRRKKFSRTVSSELFAIFFSPPPLSFFISTPDQNVNGKRVPTRRDF